MSKYVTFGEIMMRLQPPSYRRLAQADSFDIYYGGCEANVAVSLAQWGEDASFVTKLPKNQLGSACRNSVRKWGADTSKIVFGGERLGIYFTEKGASQRPSGLVYDRAGSSFAKASADDFDFDAILKGAQWFHFSGITPALSDGLREITKTAVKKAKSLGIKISCDLNYRSKLWSCADAAKTMAPLIEDIDLLIINENQAGEVFGIHGDTLEALAKAVSERFRVKNVAVTKRRTVSGEVNNFSASLFGNGRFCESRTYSIFLIDKIGGGDSFAAGLLFALGNGYDTQKAIDFATAAACFKHSVEGDMNVSTADEITMLMNSDGTGRFIR